MVGMPEAMPFIQALLVLLLRFRPVRHARFCRLAVAPRLLRTQIPKSGVGVGCGIDRFHSGCTGEGLWKSRFRASLVRVRKPAAPVETLRSSWDRDYGRSTVRTAPRRASKRRSQW